MEDSKTERSRSPVSRKGYSNDNYDKRHKKKSTKDDFDPSRKVHQSFPMVPPNLSSMGPSSKGGNFMPVLLPGMPLPAPVLMNLNLPPPDSDPDEIKKALKMIMSNFPGSAPKDAKLPFAPSSRPPPSRKKKRREQQSEKSPPTLSELLEREVDKRLEDIEKFHEPHLSKFFQVSGLLSKRHLKSSTIDEFEKLSQRRKYRINYLDLDQKLSRKLCTFTPSLENIYGEYKKYLREIERVLPIVNSS